MFFDKFKKLCRERHISPTAAAIDMGLSNSVPTKWKKTGATPKFDTLRLIADYFGVSIGYLTGEEDEFGLTHDDWVAIGQLARGIRENANIGVAYLEDELGVDGSAIEAFEAGTDPIEKKYLVGLCGLAGKSDAFNSFYPYSSQLWAQKNTAAQKGDGVNQLDAQLIECLPRLTDVQKQELLAQIDKLLSYR